MASARPLPPALKLLGTDPNRAVDAALLEALPHLDPDVQGPALDTLVQREHGPTLLALVVRVREFGEPFREQIIRRVGGLHSALRSTIGSTALEDRAAAIDLIVGGNDAALAYLLADALRSPCHRTRELAANGLHEMTRRMVDEEAPSKSSTAPAASTHRRHGIVEALRTAVSRWELHFQPKVLEAALWMGDQTEPAILEKLQAPHAKIAHMLAEILEGASDPRLAGAVLRALAVPALRAAAARAVTQGNKPPFLRALLRESWLLGDPELERGLRWVQEGPSLDHGSVDLPRLKEPEVNGLARIIAGVGGSQERKTANLHKMIETAHPIARRAALWRLIDDPGEKSTDVLRMIAARGGDELAPIAARELRRRTGDRTARPPQPAMLGRSADESPFPDAWKEFWNDFAQLSPAQRTDQAPRIRAEVQDAAQRIRAKLRAADAADRTRALQIAKTLGFLHETEDEVHRLVNDPDQVVRATSVSALSELPGPTTVRLLRAALNDPDERVQANAVEALDRLKVDDLATSLRAKLASPNSRIRANAVRALLRLEVREAGEVLLEMLEGPSTSDRASALWVIERLHLRSVLRRVADISRSDPDDRVRRRARRMVSELTLGSTAEGPMDWDPRESLR